MSVPVREKRREIKREQEAKERIGNWKTPVSANYGKSYDRIFGKKRKKSS